MASPASVLPDNSSVQSTPRKPRKHPVVRKSSNKSKLIQEAVISKRVNGDSKTVIAEELGIARNTVTSIIELNGIERVEHEIADQIAKYRRDAIALAPLAITAVQNQITSGDGDLGLKLLERTGVIGEDAIETARRNSHRQRSAINVLVQPGATVNVHSNENANDNTNTVTVQANNSTVNDDKNDNVNVRETDKGPAPGKQPRRGSGQ